MLVLSRKQGEQIHIGGNVTITVVKLWGGKCRIGIEAPKDIPVHRREIAERIETEKPVVRVMNDEKPNP